MNKDHDLRQRLKQELKLKRELEQEIEREEAERAAAREAKRQRDSFLTGMGVFLGAAISGWVMCHSGKDEAEEQTVAQTTTETKTDTTSSDDNDLVSDCTYYILSVAEFPSSVDFSLFGTRGGRDYVDIDFTAKNAWGAELPYTASCSSSGTKTIRRR